MGNYCCAAPRSQEYELLLDTFEKSCYMPLNRVSFKDFEERAKRLVFAEDGDNISMA